MFLFIFHCFQLGEKGTPLLCHVLYITGRDARDPLSGKTGCMYSVKAPRHGGGKWSFPFINVTHHLQLLEDMHASHTAIADVNVP